MLVRVSGSVPEHVTDPEHWNRHRRRRKHCTNAEATSEGNRDISEKEQTKMNKNIVLKNRDPRYWKKPVNSVSLKGSFYC
jgi:hypothetical protein